MAVNGSVSEGSVNGAEDSADEEGDDVEHHPKSRVVTPSNKTSRRLPMLAIGVVVLAAVVVGAILLSSGPSSSSKAKTTPTTTPGFVAFVDQAAHFHLSYPASWTVVKSSDKEVPLQLNFGAGGLDTLLVRAVPMVATVNTANEADIKAFTDSILSGTNITLLKQEAIKVNQLPGYYYLYTLPKDPVTGVTLVHSHFFVFPPQEMVSLTFQTVSADFAGQATTFDKVVSSLQAGG
jgi:hypothetical protein